ncbi:MAG: glucosaminidase domain-containing protein [Lachnospiraceae bacterium]|nr:glucosaminidase domain-containing protein [Lachnospiraceae bacterium]
MKRKLALLLAGCLAISPAAAGYYPAQALAAETDAGSESGDPVPAKISVSVKDENETVLSAISNDAGQEEDTAKYSMSVGETRQLTALIEQGEEFPALSVWNSETPEIIDIDDDGFITAKSAGAGLISLSISSDISQNPTEFKYEILVLEPEIVVSEEITAVTEDSAPAPAETTDEAAAAPEAEPAAETKEETAEPAAEAADSAEATVSGDPAAAPETEPVAAAEPEAVETAADEAAAAPEATVSGDPTAAAAAEPTESSAAAIAMNAAVETGNTSSKVSPAQGALVTPHWEGSYSSGWRYIKNDGTKSTGKMSIDGKIYIFNSAGEMCTGWTYYGNAWYYLERSGEAKKGWYKEGRTWYYLTGDGSMKTGRLDLGSSSFLFNNSGAMQTGWAWYGGKWYYMDSDGYMKKGWYKEGRTWYYLTGDGSMKTGRLDLGSSSFIFNNSGAMLTGWAWYGGKWYYMDSNGYMKRGWLWNGGHWYYLTSDGSMKTGWLTDGKAKYYLNADGSMKTGWLKTGGKWYFLNSSGAMKTGWLWNGGYWYYLASDGAMKTGWFWDGKNWYYFNKAGDMRSGWLEENGAKYYLGSSGAMLTGSQKIGGTWYYFNGDGSLAVSTNSYSNTEEFIQCIAPLVIKYAPQYNVKVYSPIIAQAILESASGESSLGKQYNNFFGLKCGTLWTGKSVNLRTGEEYTPGSYTTISANFRVYDTMEEGVRGYFEFLFRNRTRYNNLIGETDPYEYLVKIKADGYATSSNYVRNVYNVIKSYNLTRFDP